MIGVGSTIINRRRTPQGYHLIFSSAIIIPQRLTQFKAGKGQGLKVTGTKEQRLFLAYSV